MTNLISYTNSFDIIDLISYMLSWMTMFFTAVYAWAFSKHMNSPDDMVKNLSCAITTSCILLFSHTAIWDVGLRTAQLIQDGYFTSRSIGFMTRLHYMVIHFFGFVFVSWRLGSFLRLTIPQRDRKNWPWWKAPFYPNTSLFW